MPPPKIFMMNIQFIKILPAVFKILCRLDGRHVVFGKVLSGMDVVYKVEAEGKQSGTPKSKVVIADSGELPL